MCLWVHARAGPVVICQNIYLARYSRLFPIGRPIKKYFFSLYNICFREQTVRLRGQPQFTYIYMTSIDSKNQERFSLYFRESLAFAQIAKSSRSYSNDLFLSFSRRITGRALTFLFSGKRGNRVTFTRRDVYDDTPISKFAISQGDGGT